MKKITFILAVICSMTLWAEEKNGIVYVSPSGSGMLDGSSWENALDDIQMAVNEAKKDSENRKDVWVAAGEYTISTCLVLADSVNMYGGFAGSESAVSERAKSETGGAWEFTNPTILKGNGERLIRSAAPFDMETIFDGFTLTDGNAKTDANGTGNGGGAFIRRNVVIQNCIIKNCIAATGGGVHLYTGGTIRNSLIEGNTQSGGNNGGGGIYSNTNGETTVIENCVIRNNTAEIAGGIRIQGSGQNHVRNVKAYNNKAEKDGSVANGAAIFTNSAGNTISNCLVYNNSGSNAIYLNGGNLYNNTVVKNIGGVYIAGGSSCAINNIVWGCAVMNEGTEAATSITGAAGAFKIENNGIYNPLPEDKGWEMSGNFRFSSNISNGVVEEPAEGTVGSGPRFLIVTPFTGVAADEAEEEEEELEYADWNLYYTSPCVNAGKTYDAVSIDYAGVSRPQGWPDDQALYDVGAYEVPYYAVTAGEAEDAGGALLTEDQTVLPLDSMQRIPSGKEFKIYIEPALGYKVGRAYYKESNDGGLTFTGSEIDFTDEIDMDDQSWATTVFSSFKIYIEWESVSSYPEISWDDIKVISKNKAIEVSGIEKGQIITVYNVNGMLIYTSKADQEQMLIPASEGVYVVRIADSVKKIVVK